MSDPSTSTASQSLTGRLLAGRYLLGKLIGQGGMGSVYQAHDQQMSNRVVAIKILALHLVGDEKQVARFEQEARAANQLGHPNTISVLDFGQSDGLLYMVMEYLTGETLTQVLRRGRLPVQRALYMVRQVLKSLAEAHSKGIIHRDLKPDNIFVCEIYGEKDFIKVIDFGIAKFLASGGQELTQAGKMFGTPRYLSPEQAQGLPLTPASDLYALGVILFEMIAGRPPFVADDPIAVAIKHVQERAPRMADVVPELGLPAAVDDFVAHLLTKKAIDRYQSAEEVLDAIEDVLALSAEALGSTRQPTGQHREMTGQVRAPGAGTRTPARPQTVPPTSRSDAPGDSTDANDATQALRVPTPAGALAVPAEPSAAPDDQTRALPTPAGTPSRPAPAVAATSGYAADNGAVAVGGGVGPAQATLALSEADVAALRPAAVEGVAGRSAAGTGHATSGGATAAAHSLAEPAAPPARSKGWVLALVGLAGLAGLAAVVVRGGEPAKVEAPARLDPPAAADTQAVEAVSPSPAVAVPAPPAPQAAADPTPAAAAAPATAVAAEAAPVVAPETLSIELQVDSDPPGALVVIDGIDLGTTPQKLKLSKGVAQNVLLRLPGYLDEVLETDKLYKVATLMAEQNRKVTQKLRPKPVARPAKKPAGKPEVQW